MILIFIYWYIKIYDIVKKYRVFLIYLYILISSHVDTLGIQNMILFGTGSVYWIKNDNPIHYTTYFMDHEINNNITALYCVYLMWQKVLLKNIFDYFEHIKEKYSYIKIIIIYYSLLVKKIEQGEYTMLVKLYIVHTLVKKTEVYPVQG